MNKNLDKYLVKKYPLLFADRYGDMRSTCMCWGFDIGNGWYSIIKRAAEQLEPLIKEEKRVIDTLTQRHRKFYWKPLKAIADTCIQFDWWFRGKIARLFRVVYFDNKVLLFITQPLRSAYFFLYKQAGLYETMYMSHARASQVKEKYGTLRFYLSHGSDQMFKVTAKAEKESQSTCEQCGKPGKIRGKFWLYTACLKHTRQEDR